MTTKKRSTRSNGAQVAEPEAKTAPAQEQQAAPELTIQDLTNLRSIVEVATQRGAFRAAELTKVGTSFDRLNTFLTAVAEANAEKEEAVEE